MFRSSVCLAAMLLVAVVSTALHRPRPQTATPHRSDDHAKPSKMKLTIEKLKEMRAKWAMNKPKLKACRVEVKKKGLAGDDRWFFIEECMDKT